MQTDFDLTLDWPIISICNYQCTYCYARRDLRWGKIVPKKSIDYLISEISRSSCRFSIDVTGGEPTLHPLWRYITRSLSSLPNIAKVRLTTNGSNPASGDIGAKTLLAYSWHYLAEDGQFIKAILSTQYPMEAVEIMPMPGCERRIEHLVSVLREHNIPYHIPVILGHSGVGIMNPMATDEPSLVTNIVGARSHKGELCRRNYVETDVEGNILTKCLPQVNIYSTNFISTFVPSVVPCPSDKWCNVDGMLEGLVI